VVIGVPADDDPSSPNVSVPDEVVPDELLLSLLVPCATVAVRCVPIEPDTPMTPKAIANVMSAVAQTRRRIALSRSARAWSFAAASSRGVGALEVMANMVVRASKDVLKAAWEIPESAPVELSGPGAVSRLAGPA
jgi:hypothetical protein